ncbi:MAG: transcriptional regulator [Candidatus Hydrogenedentes bacterium]|nr:transcriptional regulator [Candidatus Hydrogenedentota bacterium]
MSELDKLIHQPVRLRIMASLVALDPQDQVDFTYLRELLDVTDGNLGAHLQKLEASGYIRVEKTFVARKPRTFIAATPKGHGAYDEHVEALKRILSGGEKPGT